MVDDIKDYEIVDAKDLTSEEILLWWRKTVKRELAKAVGRGLKPEEWKKFVRDEIDKCLEIFFPVIKSGNIGIKYTNPVAAQHESGPEYDKSKAIGVTINLVFDFEKTIDIPRD